MMMSIPHDLDIEAIFEEARLSERLRERNLVVASAERLRSLGCAPSEDLLADILKAHDECRISTVKALYAIEPEESRSAFRDFDQAYFDEYTIYALNLIRELNAPR